MCVYICLFRSLFNLPAFKGCVARCSKAGYELIGSIQRGNRLIKPNALFALFCRHPGICGRACLQRCIHEQGGLEMARLHNRQYKDALEFEEHVMLSIVRSNHGFPLAGWGEFKLVGSLCRVGIVRRGLHWGNASWWLASRVSTVWAFRADFLRGSLQM